MNSDGMVTESLGTLFRQMRRSQQKTLEDAAAETCINIRALKALEADDYSAMRAEVFVRGFIKNYAEYLGMDPKEAIAVYERSGLRPPTHEHHSPAEEEGEDDNGDDGMFPVWKKALSALVVLAVIVYAGIMLFSPDREEQQISTPSGSGVAKESLGPPVVAAPTKPAPAPQPEPEKTREKAPEPPEPAAAATPPVRKSIPAAAAEKKAQPEPPKTPPPPRYTVTATFVEPTWMKLHIDGGPARQYTYHPGEKRVWKARKKIRFFIGNAGGIRLNVNGEDMPPLGPSGEVAKLMIPDGLEKLRRMAEKQQKKKNRQPAAQPSPKATARPVSAAPETVNRTETAQQPALPATDTADTAAGEPAAPPGPQAKAVQEAAAADTAEEMAAAAEPVSPAGEEAPPPADDGGM